MGPGASNQGEVVRWGPDLSRRETRALSERAVAEEGPRGHRGEAAPPGEPRKEPLRGARPTGPLIQDLRPPEERKQTCRSIGLVYGILLRRPEQTNGNTHTHTRTHTRARTRARAHAEARTPPPPSQSPRCPSLCIWEHLMRRRCCKGETAKVRRPCSSHRGTCPSVGSFTEPRSPRPWFRGGSRVLRVEPQSAKVTLSKSTKGK